MQACLIAPVPQFRLSPTERPFEFCEGFSIRHMDPHLRKAMLKAIGSGSASEDAKSVTIEADSVAIAAIPEPQPVPSSAVISGALYRAVADSILQRLVDCLRLWEDVPEVFERSCWFVAEGTPEKLELARVKLTDTGWKCPSYPTGVLVRTCIPGARKLRDILASLQGIDALNQVFANKRKQASYHKAGNEYSVRQAKQLGKRVVMEPDLPLSPGPVKRITIPRSFSSRWFIDGYMAAYLNEVEKLNQAQNERPPSQRFRRAFQIFTSSFRVSNPFRYIALATCLEALFGLGTQELAFQLAARGAWLLHPKSPDQRKALFEEIRTLYNLRSTIVHGSSYDLKKLSVQEGKLLATTRQALLRILESPEIRRFYIEAKQEECDKFLKWLALGELPAL